MGILGTGSCEKIKIYHGDTENTEKKLEKSWVFLRVLCVSVVFFYFFTASRLLNPRIHSTYSMRSI